MDLSSPNPEETARLLRALSEPGAGQPVADGLLVLVYDELKRLARGYLGRQGKAKLQATSLVHEAFLKLVDQTRVDWKGRAHFLGVAAQAMRRILVDHARSSGRTELNTGIEQLASDELGDGETEVQLVALDAALKKLAALSERRARIVELRFFGGLDVDSTAEVLGVSAPTITREWRFARAWLTEELRSAE